MIRTIRQLYCLPRDGRTDLVGSIVADDLGEQSLDIRWWYRGVPTRKGIRLPLYLLPSLEAAVAEFRDYCNHPDHDQAA